MPNLNETVRDTINLTQALTAYNKKYGKEALDTVLSEFNNSSNSLSTTESKISKSEISSEIQESTDNLTLSSGNENNEKNNGSNEFELKHNTLNNPADLSIYAQSPDVLSKVQEDRNYFSSDDQPQMSNKNGGYPHPHTRVLKNSSIPSGITTSDNNLWVDAETRRPGETNYDDFSRIAA